MAHFVAPHLRRFVGAVGVPVGPDVVMSYGRLSNSYKHAAIPAPPSKRFLRFESPSRTRFLRRQKLPLRQWMSKSHVIMELLDDAADRGL